jgi:hypothetical protein
MSSICGEIINNCKNKYLLVISAGILGMKKWGTHPNPSIKKRGSPRRIRASPEQREGVSSFTNGALQSFN